MLGTVAELRTCRVSYRDLEGVTHMVEVSASSLHEAAVLALKAFEQTGWADHPVGVMEVVVRSPAVGQRGCRSGCLIIADYIRHILNIRPALATPRKYLGRSTASGRGQALRRREILPVEFDPETPSNKDFGYPKLKESVSFL
jgi:hypothetical protein